MSNGAYLYVAVRAKFGHNFYFFATISDFEDILIELDI